MTELTQLQIQYKTEIEKILQRIIKTFYESNEDSITDTGPFDDESRTQYIDQQIPLILTRLEHWYQTKHLDEKFKDFLLTLPPYHEDESITLQGLPPEDAIPLQLNHALFQYLDEAIQDHYNETTFHHEFLQGNHESAELSNSDFHLKKGIFWALYRKEELLLRSVDLTEIRYTVSRYFECMNCTKSSTKKDIWACNFDCFHKKALNTENTEKLLP